MKRTHVGLTLALTLSLGLIVAFLLLAGLPTSPALAQSGTGTVRVARSHPSAVDSSGCGSVGTPCQTIQYAVDEAQPGEEVLVAEGWYDDGQNFYGGTDQVVYISKTLELRGGYTYTNWAMSDPDQYRTVIDAEGDGRAVMITGPITVTIEGFEIINGDGTEQQGCDGQHPHRHDQPVPQPCRAACQPLGINQKHHRSPGDRPMPLPVDQVDQDRQTDQGQSGK